MQLVRLSLGVLLATACSAQPPLTRPPGTWPGYQRKGLGDNPKEGDSPSWSWPEEVAGAAGRAAGIILDGAIAGIALRKLTDTLLRGSSAERSAPVPTYTQPPPPPPPFDVSRFRGLTNAQLRQILREIIRRSQASDEAKDIADCARRNLIRKWFFVPWSRSPHESLLMLLEWQKRCQLEAGIEEEIVIPDPEAAEAAEKKLAKDGGTWEGWSDLVPEPEDGEKTNQSTNAAVSARKNQIGTQSAAQFGKPALSAKTGTFGVDAQAAKKIEIPSQAKVGTLGTAAVGSAIQFGGNIANGLDKAAKVAGPTLSNAWKALNFGN